MDPMSNLSGLGISHHDEVRSWPRHICSSCSNLQIQWCRSEMKNLEINCHGTENSDKQDDLDPTHDRKTMRVSK